MRIHPPICARSSGTAPGGIDLDGREVEPVNDQHRSVAIAIGVGQFERAQAKLESVKRRSGNDNA